jgi:hypothetical protein
MEYLGNDTFKSTARDRAKKVILGSYYLLCIIPYIYLLTHQPFYCIASSFLLTFIEGCGWIIFFATRKDEAPGGMGWAVYLTFAPGVIMLILSPALFLQKVSEIIQNSP